MFAEKFFQLLCTWEIFMIEWGKKKFLFVIALKSTPLLVIYCYVTNYPRFSGLKQGIFLGMHPKELKAEA